jgi:hypothetical protein
VRCQPLAAAPAVQLNSIFLAKMNPRENPGGENMEIVGREPEPQVFFLCLTGKLREAFLFCVPKLIAIFVMTLAILRAKKIFLSSC